MNLTSEHTYFLRLLYLKRSQRKVLIDVSIVRHELEKWWIWNPPGYLDQWDIARQWGPSILRKLLGSWADSRARTWQCWGPAPSVRLALWALSTHSQRVMCKQNGCALRATSSISQLNPERVAFNKTEKKTTPWSKRRRFIQRRDNYIDEKGKASTSIFWHSGNCLHDTDKVIFIVTELSKHIKQAASHDLPREQQERHVSRLPANTYVAHSVAHSVTHSVTHSVAHSVTHSVTHRTDRAVECITHKHTHTYWETTGGLEPCKAEHEKHEDGWPCLSGVRSAVKGLQRILKYTWQPFTVYRAERITLK